MIIPRPKLPWTEVEFFSSKLDHRASVKGKKAIARARVHKETF